MEMKTRVLLEWHLGIPDGEERYQTICDYTDDVEEQKVLAMETVKKSHLLERHDVEELYADANYGRIGIRIKSDDVLHEIAAEVTIEHFLKAGKTYFKLEKTDI